jgi:hypothetical protein
MLVEPRNYHTKLETHIGKQEEREKVDKSIRQRFVLFKRFPELDNTVSSRISLQIFKNGLTCFQPIVRYDSPLGRGGPGRCC